MAITLFNTIGLGEQFFDDWHPRTVQLARLAYEGGWPWTKRVTDVMDAIIRASLGVPASSLIVSNVFITDEAGAVFQHADLLGAAPIGAVFVDNQPITAVDFDPAKGSFDFAPYGVLPAGAKIMVTYYPAPDEA